MKKLIYLCLCLFAMGCGSNDEGKEKEAEAASKWTLEEITMMNSSCAKETKKNEPTISEVNAYSRCGCNNEVAAKRWTLEDFLKNAVSYLEILKADGTIAKCLAKYP